MEGSKKQRRATRPWITLRNDAAAVAIDAAGGSIASFVLGDGVNPLSWDSAVHDQQDVEKTAPRPLGHFLCLDRWGPPSVAEEAQGMPYHGEASSRHWHVVELDSPVVRLEAQLPMAGLAVERRLELVKCQAARRAVDAPQGGAAVLAAVLKVQNEVKNINQLGRIFNMVQHPSIAAPFLSAETRVDCNGKRGFTQGPRGCAEVLWHAPREFPAAVTARDGVRDAHGMTGGADDVFSYEVDPKETYGWVCASTPSQGLLLGYVWPRAEYPWVSLWCSSEVDGDQRPRARGLEFGTTGLHQPFPILTKHPRIFDLPTFEHLDAAPSSTRKSFCSFLLSIPSHFRGVQRVELVAAAAAAPARKLRIWEKDTGSSVEIAAETELL